MKIVRLKKSLPEFFFAQFGWHTFVMFSFNSWVCMEYSFNNLTSYVVMNACIEEKLQN